MKSSRSSAKGGKKKKKNIKFKVGQHVVYPAHGVGHVTGIEQEVIKRTMWSRRAQEYEAKINSGDLILLSEVVRDLHRGETQPDQSYSERQLYECALDRLVREIAAINKVNRGIALDEVLETLTRARTRQAEKAAKAAESENDNGEGEGADEAAA